MESRERPSRTRGVVESGRFDTQRETSNVSTKVLCSERAVVPRWIIKTKKHQPQEEALVEKARAHSLSLCDTDRHKEAALYI